MYICEICATAFDTPSTVTDTNTDGEHIWRESLRTCPICATAERFNRATPCPGCDSWMPHGDILCRSCRLSLKNRFTAFAGELTAEEEEQLDAWLDGDTIQNRGKWT